MNPDPVFTRFREISWRRELTIAEQSELRAWLAAHPEAQADWVGDEELNGLLRRLPDAPMPSNFTARVLQAVEREPAVTQRVADPQSSRWWQVLWPRAAVALVVVGLGLFTYQQRETTRRATLAKSLTTITDVQSLPSPQTLADYETIRRLSPVPVADEELLALLQ